MANAHYLNNFKFERQILGGDHDAVARSLYKLAEHVVAIKLHTLPPGLEPDEVVQRAVIDAMRRLEAWEPGRSSAFSYATGSIRFTIMAACKCERMWAARYTTLVFERDEEAVPC